MKNLSIILLFISMVLLSSGKLYAQCDNLLDVCHGKLGDARFLKSYNIQMGEQRGGSVDQVSFKQPLTAGTTYKFFACNDTSLPGKVIITIRNPNDEIMMTSFPPELNRHFEPLQFTVNASGIYTISYFFEDGKQGCAVGVVASVK